MKKTAKRRRSFRKADFLTTSDENVVKKLLGRRA
jgi:ribosomal protein L35